MSWEQFQCPHPSAPEELTDEKFEVAREALLGSLKRHWTMIVDQPDLLIVQFRGPVKNVVIYVKKEKQ